jgi:uncharacterized membrane protein YgcG
MPHQSPSASVKLNDQYIVPFVLSVVSLLGSTVVLLTFASAKRLRTFLLQPVLLMILFDAFASVGNILMFLPPIVGWDSMDTWNPLACSLIAAILGNLAQQLSILFYLCVVINMIITMTRKSTEETTEDFRRYMSRAVFLETIVVGVYCLGSSSYLYIIGAFGAVDQSSERYECWIKQDFQLYRLVLYVPLIATMLIAAASLLFIWLHGARRMMPEAWRYTSRRIMLFVVVFLCLWTVPTIFRMYELASPNYSPPDWLLITVKTLYGVNGLVNSFVWTSSRPFLDVYRKSRWCRVCCHGGPGNRTPLLSSSSLLDDGGGGGSGHSSGGGSGRVSNSYDANRRFQKNRHSSGTGSLYSGTSSINLGRDIDEEEDVDVASVAADVEAGSY